MHSRTRKRRLAARPSDYLRFTEHGARRQIDFHAGFTSANLRSSSFSYFSTVFPNEPQFCSITVVYPTTPTPQWPTQDCFSLLGKNKHFYFVIEIITDKFVRRKGKFNPLSTPLGQYATAYLDHFKKKKKKTYQPTVQ